MNPSYGIFLWIIIGAAAGWIASIIMKTKQGLGMDVIIGVVGALIGGFLTRVLFGDNFANNGLFASFGVALLGAVVLLGVVKAVSGRMGGGKAVPH